jgi:hypothetical protein
MKPSSVVMFICLTACSVAIAQTKRALLIGIDTYEPPGGQVKVPAGTPAEGRFATGIRFANLQGPTHDVDAMRDLLTGVKFGFPNDDQHIHILRDSAATHDAILAAMHKYLVQEPERGDTVVLYISSHGSLRVNSLSDGQAYDLQGKPTPLDNTIVPADAYLGAEDVLNRDLRRIFIEAADKGVHLTAIIDACHSGGQARGASDPGRVARSLGYDPRDLHLAPDKNPDGSPVTAPEDRKDNPVLVFSAAQKDQSAIELQNASPPHGVFTNALVETLEALPANAPAADVFRRVLVDMETSGENQQPALDTTPERKRQPLFGGDASKGPLRASVVSVEGKTAVLDIGPVADIGTDSEFTEMNAQNGAKAVLKVTEAVSIARSNAVVLSPDNALVRPKDIVELTKWVPAPRPELLFYAGPSNLTIAQIQSALTALRSTKSQLVADPSSDSWTHIIAWDGTNWTLQARTPNQPADPNKRTDTALTQSQAAPAVRLGPTLNAANLSRRLAKESIIWFNPPLPSDIAPGLLQDKTVSAKLVSDRTRAMYIATGTANPTGLAYAWYKRGDYDAGVQTPSGLGAGCSPGSPMPLRTEWVTVASDTNTPATLSAGLTASALLLARLNGWLHLESTVNGAQSFPYTLGLKRVADSQFAADGGKTYQNERYSLALNGSADTIDVEPRWVYVVSIDCQGKGELLWPRGPGGRFPTTNGRLASIPLPGATIKITPPYGTDTYVLLTTTTPLPEPEVLSFDAATRGGGNPSPLQSLLQRTNAGTRGNSEEAPTDWGVQLLQMHSQPISATDAAKTAP